MLWAARSTHVAPQPTPTRESRWDSECKRWNLEHVTYSHTFKRVRSNGLFVSCRGSGFCDLFQLFASFAPTHHSPFDVLRTSLMPLQPGFVSASPLGSTSTAVCCNELDIEFEPTRLWTKQFLHSLQLSLKHAATCTRHRPSEAGIARERKLLNLRVIFLCDRYKISQDRMWNLDETAVRMVPSGERGWTKWTKKGESANVFASRAFVTVTLAANMRGPHVDHSFRASS